MTKCHQIVCGLELGIQDGTYHESLNCCCKQKLSFKNNHIKTFISGFNEQFHALKNTSRYSEVLFPYRLTIHLCDKDASFASMCGCLDKDIKSPKW